MEVLERRFAAIGARAKVERVRDAPQIASESIVAAVPEDARGVGSVVAAKDALQPEAVRAAVARVRPRDRFPRRNAAYVRHGESFFPPFRDRLMGQDTAL